MTPDSSSQPAPHATSPSATPTPDADPTLDPGPVPAGDGANPDGAAAQAAQRFDLVWRDGMLTVGQDSEPASSLLIADIRLAQKSPLIRTTPWGPMPDGSYRAVARVRDEVIRDLVARHDEEGHPRRDADTPIGCAEADCPQHWHPAP